MVILVQWPCTPAIEILLPDAYGQVSHIIRLLPPDSKVAWVEALQAFLLCARYVTITVVITARHIITFN